MYKISDANELRKAILLLESELDEQKNLLIQQVSIMYESFRPVNLIKDVFKEVVASEEFRSNILTATMGISTGYITKKLLFGRSSNLFKVLSGNLLQYGIANLIINPPRVLRSILLPLLEIFGKRHSD